MTFNHYQIAKLRTSLDMTKTELAKSAEIDLSYVSRIEMGAQSPTVRILCRIADSLGIDDMNVFFNRE